jgi:hypothetical protein
MNSYIKSFTSFSSSSPSILTTSAFIKVGTLRVQKTISVDIDNSLNGILGGGGMKEEFNLYLIEFVVKESRRMSGEAIITAVKTEANPMFPSATLKGRVGGAWLCPFFVLRELK